MTQTDTTFSSGDSEFDRGVQQSVFPCTLTLSHVPLRTFLVPLEGANPAIIIWLEGPTSLTVGLSNPNLWKGSLDNFINEGRSGCQNISNDNISVGSGELQE